MIARTSLVIAGIFLVIFLGTYPIDGLPKERSKSEGKQLADLYCSACHKPPDPNELEREVWKDHVLPRMGAMMGIEEYSSLKSSWIQEGVFDPIDFENGPFSKEFEISNKDWKQLVDYYIDNAPSRIGVRSVETDSIRPTLLSFPSMFLSPPSTIHTSFTENGLLFSDINSNALFELDGNLDIVRVLNLPGGIVDLDSSSNSTFLTGIGSFSPTSKASGYVALLDDSNKVNIIIDSLRRPVHTKVTDLDLDFQHELLISEYGKWNGGLSLWSKDEHNTYTRNVIAERSGCLKTDLIDIDNDGDMDIIALFGQGDEGFKIYINQGSLYFDEIWMHRFSPSMGSVGFELLDIDQDDQMEIVYWAGDMADLPYTTKPYQGIYIFEFGSASSLIQTKFWPFPGCYKVIALNLDDQAPLDLVACSFFPDHRYQNPNDLLILFRNGPTTYTKSLNLSAHGRWISMSAGDLDRDGSIELLLGSLLMKEDHNGSLNERWLSNGLPFVLLKDVNQGSLQ